MIDEKESNSKIKESLDSILMRLDEVKENTENIKYGIANVKTMSRVECEKLRQDAAKHKSLSSSRSRG